MKRKTTSLFYSVVIARMMMIALLSMLTTLAYAQTVTFNTTTGTTGYTGANSAGTGLTAYITFAIENNSGAPIKLTKVGNWVVTGDGPHTLYYSSTSLSGAVDLSLTSVWFNAGGTNSTIPSATASVQEVLNNINFVIPTGVTYRFALQKAAGTNRYSGAAVGDCTPSTFTNNGVTLLCGQATIASSYVGYGAGNNPRWFTGFVTYELMPQGPNNASISKLVSPGIPFCSGNHDVAVRLKNSGTNVLSNVLIKWTLDNVAQTPITWTSPLDTFGGTLYPNDTTITLATAVPFTSARSIRAWTELPNGVADTSNGDDTILVNLTPALNGSFTIGGTSPDFATPQAAATALKTYGICGPVHFTVRPGTYSGQVDVSAIAGVSSTNTITFEGVDKYTCIVTHAYVAGSYATWTTENVNYVTLRNLTINATHASNAFGVRLNNAHNCRIINCNVNVPVNNVTTAAGIVISGSGTSYSTAGRADNLEIDSVNVTGGYFGITSYGAATTGVSTGLKLTNSQTIDFTQYGIYLYYSSSVNVSNNKITHLSSTAFSYGIYLSSLSHASSVPNTFYGNVVNSIGGTAGIYFTTAANPSATNKGVITNNVITGNYASYGLYMTAGTNWRIAHNTIYNKTNTTTVTLSPGYITGGSAITCVNNIFRTLSNTAYSFYGSAATIFDTLNYNVYSKDVKGANYFYLGSAYTDLTFIGAGSRNANSVSLNPDFMNDNMLVTKRSCLTGPAVWGVDKDINGITRNLTTPTVGAYEVIPVATDVRVEAINQPTTITTVGLQDASVLIRNEGTTALTSANVTVKVNAYAPVTVTWSGMLNPCDTVSVLFTGANQVTFDSLSKITVYTSNPNLGADLKTVNDTIKLNMYTPLSGTYTIGGPGASFADIIEAVNTMKLAGLAGPVVFNVNPGTYSGQVYMNLIPGASATNTITFVGANKATTIVTHSFLVGEYATWIIDNVSYVTLKNMTINGTHATNAWGVRLHNAHNCKIINCNVNVPVYSGSSSIGIVVAGSATSYTTAGRADNLEIDSVTVNGGYFSISQYGATAGQNLGLKLTNSKTLDYYYAGVYLVYSSSVAVSNNTIEHLSPTPSTYGMYLSSLGNAGGIANIFTNNFVNTIGTTAIYFTTATNPSATNKGIIANNVIRGNNSGYGIYMTGGTNWRFAHNSILYTNINTTVGNGPAYITGGSGISCYNNIFRTLKPVGYTFYGSAATIFDTLNYNVYSKDVKGANYIYVGAAYTDLTLIGAATWNNNSVTNNPAFTDEALGNLVPLSANIDNIAMLTPTVTTDITGALRSTTTPDVGAYEFTGVAGDVAISGAVVKRSGSCYSANDTVFVTVRNLIGTTIDFTVNPLTINWNSTGPVASSGSMVISTGTLAPDAITTVYSTTVDMSMPGNYSLKAYISSNAVNVSATNDTLTSPVLTEVKPILSMAQHNFTVTSSTDKVTLDARSPIFPSGGVFFSEISHYQYTAGAPTTGWPAYQIADDYVEITGVPNSDLAGYKMEEWSTTAMTHSVTFPAGTLFSPNGTMILATGQLNASVPSPANFYYHTGNTATHGSGYNSGYILKNAAGTIVDAAGYGSGFSFPAASGVLASDWTGATPVGTTTAGNKLNGPDNNTASNWVNSVTVPQNPNALNAGVPLPSPTALTGLTWYHNGSPIATDTTKVLVGPWTTPGIYVYVAVYTNACGTFYDTVRVTATSTVPVKLTSFTATKENADVNLNWNTASEVNNSHFEIERSVNGRDFKTMGRVKGNGTTSRPNRYVFVDANAANSSAAVLYYRLKQVDLDGAFTYSRVATVDLSQKRITSLAANPNPSNGNFTINAEFKSTSAVTIKVVNIMGTTVSTQTVNPVIGVNAFETQLQLPNGVYMLLVEQDGETSSHKLVIAE